MKILFNILIVLAATALLAPLMTLHVIFGVLGVAASSCGYAWTVTGAAFLDMMGKVVQFCDSKMIR
jgi:hypothetical protein